MREIITKIFLQIFSQRTQAQGLKTGLRGGSQASFPWLKINSLLSSDKIETRSNGSVSMLPPPAANISKYELVPVITGRGQRVEPPATAVIEVDYLQGEYVTKPLYSRMTAANIRKNSISFVAILMAGFYFAKSGNLRQPEIGGAGLSDRVAATKPSVNAAIAAPSQHIQPTAQIVQAPASATLIETAVKSEKPTASTTRTPVANQTAAPVTSTPLLIDDKAQGAAKPLLTSVSPVYLTASFPSVGMGRPLDQYVPANKQNQSTKKINPAQHIGGSGASKQMAGQKDRETLTPATAEDNHKPSANSLLGGLARAVLDGPIGYVVGSKTRKAMAQSWGLGASIH